MGLCRLKCVASSSKKNDREEIFWTTLQTCVQSPEDIQALVLVEMKKDPVYLQETPFNNSLYESSSFALLAEATEEVNQPKAEIYILTCPQLQNVTDLVDKSV